MYTYMYIYIYIYICICRGVIFASERKRRARRWLGSPRPWCELLSGQAPALSLGLPAQIGRRGAPAILADTRR